MRMLYNDMDIHFSLEGVSFHALNIVFEHFERTIPSHIHGNGCYEIHYISTGHGKLKANDTYFELTPNTLFVTGPHVEHAQTPVPDDPMEEYCVYFKLDSSSHMKKMLLSFPPLSGLPSGSVRTGRASMHLCSGFLTSWPNVIPVSRNRFLFF